MQLAGAGVFGPPPDPAAARDVLRRAVELGIDHIDTAQYYGHGYATRLMDLLAARLEQEPRAHAALLFSDVGPRNYARSGYRELPAWDRFVLGFERRTRLQRPALTIQSRTVEHGTRTP